MLNDKISGSAITALRETLGETRVSFAERVGTNSESVRRWEKDEATPTGLRKENIEKLLADTVLRKELDVPDPWTPADLNALQEKLGAKDIADFAKKLGVSDRIIVKWRAGRMNLMSSSLKTLNRAYRQAYSPKPEKKTRVKRASPGQAAVAMAAAGFTPADVKALRERYGETTTQFGKRFKVSGSYISGWETQSERVPQKYHAKIRQMIGRVDRPPLADASTPAPARTPGAKPDKARVAVAGIMESVQSFKDRRNKTLIDDALTHVASVQDMTKPDARKLIATFLYLVWEEVPLNLLLEELTGHKTS